MLHEDAVVHRRGAGGPVLARHPWPAVRGLVLDAPASASRRPGALAVLLGAAAESAGLGWTPGTADVAVTVQDEAGRHLLECDGYIGRGYWREHLAALDAAAHLLVAHPASRAALARPADVLADLDAASGPGDRRAALASAWDVGCTCR